MRTYTYGGHMQMNHKHVIVKIHVRFKKTKNKNRKTMEANICRPVIFSSSSIHVAYVPLQVTKL